MKGTMTIACIGVGLVSLAALLSGCDKAATPATDRPVPPEAPKPEAQSHQGHAPEGQTMEHGHAKAAGHPDIDQKKCPVMGEDIDPEVFVEHEGRKVYFCCKECIPKFEKDPAKYLAKLDEMMKTGTTHGEQ